MAEATPIPAAMRPPRLLGSAFGVESFKFNRWAAVLTESQTLQDALRPEFWSEQSSIVMGHDPQNPKGIGDLICVRKLDTGDYWELLIREIGKGFIKTQLKAECKPTEIAIPDGALTTKWNVGRRCHDVIRKDGGAVMSTGHQSKEAAARWIADHMKAMAA